jgi:hypothetical protein
MVCMIPHIDGEHHEQRPLLHDFLYHVENGVPVLDNDKDGE